MDVALSRSRRTLRCIVGALAVTGLAALLVTAGFTAAAPKSDAQQQVSCPTGTTLSADGTLCLSEAVDDNVTTATSCTVGVLSADGKSCVVPRLDATPAPGTTTAGTTTSTGGGTTTQTAPVPQFTG